MVFSDKNNSPIGTRTSPLSDTMKTTRLTLLAAILILSEFQHAGAWFFDTPDNIGSRSAGEKGIPDSDMPLQKKSLMGMLVTDDDNDDDDLTRRRSSYPDLFPYARSLDRALLFIEKSKNSGSSETPRVKQMRSDLIKKMRQLQREGENLLQKDDRRNGAQVW